MTDRSSSDSLPLRARLQPFLYFGQNVDIADGWRPQGPGTQCCHQLFHVLDGTIDVSRGEADWQVRTGETLITTPGTGLRAGPGCYLRLCFDLQYRHRTVSTSGYVVPDAWTPEPAWSKVLGCDLPERITPSISTPSLPLIHRLVSTRFADPVAGLWAQGRFVGLLADLVGALLTEAPAPADRQEPSHQLVHRIEGVILERGCRPGFQLADIATALGFSLEHLSRVYRQRRGQTPSDFLRRHRIARALDLLQAATASDLSSIAAATGYRSAQSLSRAFKQEIGCSPRTWLRNSRLGQAPLPEIYSS